MSGGETSGVADLPGVSRDARRRLLQELLAKGEARLPATGSSMLPLLFPGDTLIVAPQGALQPGQILVVASGERLIAHRLARIERDSIVTRGDALRGEERFARTEVVGRVVGVARAGESRARRIDTPAWDAVGRAVIALGPAPAFTQAVLRRAAPAAVRRLLRRALERALRPRATP